MLEFKKRFIVQVNLKLCNFSAANNRSLHATEHLVEL